MLLKGVCLSCYIGFQNHSYVGRRRTCITHTQHRGISRWRRGATKEFTARWLLVTCENIPGQDLITLQNASLVFSRRHAAYLGSFQNRTIIARLQLYNCLSEIPRFRLLSDFSHVVVLPWMSGRLLLDQTVKQLCRRNIFICVEIALILK